MAVKTQCPRCKQPLSVPSKLAGSYANCPRCQGRFWISKDAPLDSSVNDSVSMSGSTLTLTQVPVAQTAPVASPPSAGSAAAAPPRAYFPSVTPLAPIPRPPQDSAAAANPPAPPPQVRKVARLVSADAADSNLKIAPDGQLPNLQLLDVDKKEAGQGKSRAIPPLVLVAAWVFSVVMTVAIFMFSGNNGSEALTRDKAKAMKDIEEQYFGDPSHVALLPYQRLLREAQQARAREDFKAEKQYYRQVLDQLRTESHSGGQSSGRHLEKGVTGSREHDRELEKLIITVLGD
jgi:hypothetical protein